MSLDSFDRGVPARRGGSSSLPPCCCSSARSASSGAPRPRTSTKVLPKACTLLTQEEAEKLATIPLQAPVQTGDDFCEWDSPPEGGVAQVEVFIESEKPNALELDRDKVTPYAGLGDEAYEEEGYIFARKGAVWIEVHLLILDDWAPYVQPLRTPRPPCSRAYPPGQATRPRSRFPRRSSARSRPEAARIPDGRGTRGASAATSTS